MLDEILHTPNIPNKDKGKYNEISLTVDTPIPPSILLPTDNGNILTSNSTEMKMIEDRRLILILFSDIFQH